MRIIEIVKKFSDGHVIRYDIQAANAPFIYVDGILDNPPQKYLSDLNYESSIDNYYIDKFQGNHLKWEQKEIVYREEIGEAGIFGGFTIKVIEDKTLQIAYECDYAGRKMTHNGLIQNMNWQNMLFEEWQTHYSQM